VSWMISKNLHNLIASTASRNSVSFSFIQFHSVSSRNLIWISENPYLNRWWLGKCILPATPRQQTTEQL
jgi:hypothetical protein